MKYRDDPLELFRDLPAIEVGADDIADMKRAVRELRRAKEIEAEATHVPTPTRSWLRTPSSPWRLAAAAAGALLGGALLLPSFGGPGPISDAGGPPSVATIAAADAWELEMAERLPLVDGVDMEAFDLIQIEDPEMSVVIASVALPSALPGS